MTQLSLTPISEFARCREDLEPIVYARGVLEGLETAFRNLDPHGGSPYTDEDYKVLEHHRIKIDDMNRLTAAVQELAKIVQELHSQMFQGEGY